MSQPHEFEEEEFTTQFNGQTLRRIFDADQSHTGRTWSDLSA